MYDTPCASTIVAESPQVTDAVPCASVWDCCPLRRMLPRFTFVFVSGCCLGRVRLGRHIDVLPQVDIWALDSFTYKLLVMSAFISKRKQYEDLLSRAATTAGPAHWKVRSCQQRRGCD